MGGRNAPTRPPESTQGKPLLSRAQSRPQVVPNGGWRCSRAPSRTSMRGQRGARPNGPHGRQQRLSVHAHTHAAPQPQLPRSQPVHLLRAEQSRGAAAPPIPTAVRRGRVPWDVEAAGAGAEGAGLQRVVLALPVAAERRAATASARPEPPRAHAAPARLSPPQQPRCQQTTHSAQHARAAQTVSSTARSTLAVLCLGDGLRESHSSDV